jgi:hypothetical protein
MQNVVIRNINVIKQLIISNNYLIIFNIQYSLFIDEEKNIDKTKNLEIE